jgi:serine/threonine protein kinase
MRSADPESFTGTDRFVVQRRLGAGSFGVVYEVLDRERNTNVALKTLRVSAGRTLYRFKQEFGPSPTSPHPNFVTVMSWSARASSGSSPWSSSTASPFSIT